MALKPLPMADLPALPASTHAPHAPHAGDVRGARGADGAQRKPAWLKVRAPGGERYAALKALVRDLGLHTVCEEARCPNLGECWSSGTLTLMLLGDTCTRACRFCDVKTGRAPDPPDPREPERTAAAVAALGLEYVVLTMVDRDDLPDGGAAHVAETVRAIKRSDPHVLVEVLSGDFQGDAAALAVVAGSGADVLAHNVETVARLQREVRDARCGYDLSLEVLAAYRRLAPGAFTKSSLMLGLGEREDEVVGALADLRAAGVEVVTLGQYLRPSGWHLPVLEYVEPERFDALAERARGLGFAYCAAGPLVRSSYKAAEFFVSGALAARRAERLEAVGTGSASTSRASTAGAP